MEDDLENPCLVVVRSKKGGEPSIVIAYYVLFINITHYFTYNRLFIVLCLVAQSCLTLCDPLYCRLPGSSVHGDSPGQNTGVGCHAFLQGDLPYPGIELRSPTLQVDSSPSELQGVSICVCAYLCLYVCG